MAESGARCNGSPRPLESAARGARKALCSATGSAPRAATPPESRDDQALALSGRAWLAIEPRLGVHVAAAPAGMRPGAAPRFGREVRNGVEARRSPRVAAADAGGGQPAADPCAVARDRLFAVLRAGGEVAALSAEHGREGDAVAADQPAQCAGGDAAAAWPGEGQAASFATAAFAASSVASNVSITEAWRDLCSRTGSR